MAKKNGTWKVVATVVAMIALLAGGVAGYTKAMVRIAVTETEVSHVKDDIKEIKGDVKEILKAVRGE